MLVSAAGQTDVRTYPLQRRFYAAALLLLLIYVAVRWTNLLELPLFIDEATGLNRARDALVGYPFQGMKHDKWLPPYIWSWFRPLGPESLWLSRAVTALLSTLTCATAIGLGYTLDQKLKTTGLGLLAGTLYLALPLSIFFDRQALADPMLAAFAGVLLVVSLRLAKRPSLLHIITTGMALSLAILAKFTGLVLVPVAGLTALIMAPPEKRKQATAFAAVATALGMILVLVVLIIGDRYLEPYESPIRRQFIGGGSNIYSFTDLTFTSEALRSRWRTIGSQLTNNLKFFFTWPLTIASLAAMGWIIKPGQERRTILWLWLAGIAPMALILAITTWLPARYMGFVAIPVTLLAATAIDKLGSGNPKSRVAILLLVIVLPVARSWLLLTAPLSTNLPAEIRQSYYVDGANLAPLRTDLLSYAEQSSGPVHLIYGDIGSMQISAFWGGHMGQVIQWDGSPGQQATIAHLLLRGESVAIFDATTIPEQPYDLRTEVLGQYEPFASTTTYRLRIVTEPGPDMLRVMYNQVFGDPFALEEDFVALSTQLSRGHQTLFLYPPHQVDVLDDLLREEPIELIPLMEGWPLDMDAVQSTFLDTVGTHDFVTVAFFNETAGDPSRLIETWLSQNFYRVSERWVGAIRVLDYVSAPPVQEDFPQEATFDNVMTLETFSTVVTTLSDKQIVLIRLVWRSETATTLSYKVAAYVINEAGEVVAQYDSVPMGYLAPTNTWIPGQRVIDQFAIYLPSELSSGRYIVCIAIYDEVTLERLHLLTGEDSLDSLLISDFIITE